MEWIERMNRAMGYVEANLEGELSCDEAARLACCSTYHFQRMFASIADVPFSEYVRRRRLTLAAFALQSGEKVIDVALRYGYDSPEAFARAFKALHGVTPSGARESGARLKAYPRMTFSLSVKGDVEMEYRIIEREAFEMFGVSGQISKDMEQAFQDVPTFCRKCDEDGTVDRINALLGRPGDSYLHAALYDHKDSGFRYMICGYLPKGLPLPEGMERLPVPARTWAVFTAQGCDLPSLWRRVYAEWFPTADYEQAEGPTFEMYYGQASHENGFGELWVPVKKRG